MKILLACEESQAVCIALRVLGHEAYSCDILPCSGGHPDWHLQMDVRIAMMLYDWDAVIAFPTCTFLTVSNNGHMTHGCSKYTAEQARIYRNDAIDFFMFFVKYECPFKAIENPIGIMSTVYRRPDQIIQPFQFGENASKKTCLWLTGLPLLQPTERFPGRIVNGKEVWGNQTPSGQNRLGPSETRGHERSKTYPGIAEAMALQWFGPAEMSDSWWNPNYSSVKFDL